MRRLRSEVRSGSPPANTPRGRVATVGLAWTRWFETSAIASAASSPISATAAKTAWSSARWSPPVEPWPCCPRCSPRRCRRSPPAASATSASNERSSPLRGSPPPRRPLSSPSAIHYSTPRGSSPRGREISKFCPEAGRDAASLGANWVATHWSQVRILTGAPSAGAIGGSGIRPIFRWRDLPRRSPLSGRERMPGLGLWHFVRQRDLRQQAIQPRGHPPGAWAEQAEDDRLQQQPNQRGVEQHSDSEDEAHLLGRERARDRECHEHYDHDRGSCVDHTPRPG